MLTAPLPSSTLQSDRDDPDDPDYRLGHKRRQQARRQDRKREAVKLLLERLPPFHELPLASILKTDNDIDTTNANTNSTSAIEEKNTEKKKSTQLSDLYQPICRLDDDVTNEFWSKVPTICNPNKAVMEEKISDERDLMRERYRSDKYRRKLKKQMERGDINQTQVDDLWEKHGKRTTNTNTNIDTTEDTDTDKTNNNSQAEQKSTTTTITAATPTNSSSNNEAVSLLSNDRGQRKAWQVENFVSLLRERLSSSSNNNSRIGNSNNNNEFALTVVDFGCGSGNLCLALAPYFSQVRFVLVDKKSYSLKLAERRARDAGLKNVQIMEYEFSPSNLKDFCIPSMSRLSTMMPLSPLSSSTSELSNIVCMPVTQNNDEISTTTVQQQQSSSSSSSTSTSTSTYFDIAIGLHCCGSFTDMVMMIAKLRGADCIVCPCCNGAMTSETTCGYEYPRSSYVRKLINQDEYLSLLSRAADDLGSYEAKCFIEYDRALWANENGYNVKLLKLSPEESTPKHHVLYLTKQIQKGEEHED
jgi:2-polyprenyl-3-methyl-5-hydroxy-6-metoxy-1,4-benzoquinol methylase